ncbi:MAG: DUF4097 family beta strand repeat protein [Clostridia bacterium]|nr:DUF4097 family beta strand repeat protein [Clostridia bacterium]
MKKCLILATLLVILGGLTITMTACSKNFNFNTLFGNSFEEKAVEVDGSFNSIEIHTDTADITLISSDDGKCRVVSNDRKKIEYSAISEDGALKIKSTDTRKWYERMFSFGAPTLTVYLPKEEFASLIIDESTGNIKVTDNFNFATLNIKVSTGNVILENITADSVSVETSTGKIDMKDTACTGEITLKVSTGDTYLHSVRCKNLTSTGNTGDISVTNVIAEGKFDIERSTGDVNFDSSDAAEIYVKTDTGNVKGTLLSDKVYIVSSDTGKIDVPKTITGGRCEISTNTGNIKISVK